MRIRISHLTSYVYGTPATSVIQMLRLTPRNDDGQYVARWRIDVSIDCRLDQHEDAFGNLTHTFSTDGPFSALAVMVEGEVETRDTQGIVRGTVERFPPSLYLRATALTTPDADICAFAAASRDAADGNVLNLLHHMLERLHDDMVYDTDPTQVATTAAQAFALKRGVCQDLTHIFIAAARSLAIPARYVGGYFRRDDGVDEQGPATPGPKLSCPSSAGWLSIRPTDCAPPTPMCGSRSGSITSARHPCAAPATAAAAR